MPLTKPFGVGSYGNHVSDLQQRLNALPIDIACAVDATFGDETLAAVERFQADRSIDVDGIVGPQTWSSLVEAGFALGDRPLNFRTPNLRGDDVADLQQILSVLGYLKGRIDGIWGPSTTSSVVEFQADAGLLADGVCGARTIASLKTKMMPVVDSKSVSSLREQHRLPRSDFGVGLTGQRIALGEIGGLGPVMASVRRRLDECGALILPLNHPSWSAQAQQSNRFGAAIYVGLEIKPSAPSVCYFQGRHFSSEVGQRLAEKISQRLDSSIGRLKLCGMALPILRESQMPAVLVRFAEVGALLSQAQHLSEAISNATTELLCSEAEAEASL